MNEQISWSGDKPFCLPHQSHFCPCVRPEIYNPADKKDAEYIRGWEMIAPIVVFTGERPVVEQPSDPWTLKLNEALFVVAVEEGNLRERTARRGGFGHVVYDPGTEVSLAQNIRAAKGELALSLMTGLPWTGRMDAGGIERADVGDWYEVRGVDVPWHGLIFRPRDERRIGHPFVLTYVEGPEVTAMGWEWGSRIAVDHNKQPASSKSNMPWWLTKRLQPMNELPPKPEESP